MELIHELYIIMSQRVEVCLSKYASPSLNIFLDSTGLKSSLV